MAKKKDKTEIDELEGLDDLTKLEEFPEDPDAALDKGSETETLDMSDLSADVPVKLVAVLGKKSISLKDLFQLKQGQVIDLERPPSEVVDLVANGQLVGRGELVEIDGKLGVRILKMLK